MANAMSDIMQTLSKPLDVPNLQQGTQAGLQTGVEMAARQAQIQQMQQEMAFKRQQLEQAKLEHVTGIIDGALKEQDPTIRKIRIKQAQGVAAQVNYPMSDNFAEIANKSDDFRNKYIASLPYRDLMDPAQRSQAIQDGRDAWMGGPEEIGKFLNTMTEQQNKVKVANELGKGKETVAKLALTKDLAQYAASPEDAAILTDPSNPEYAMAAGRASVNKKKQTDIMTDQGQQKIDESKRAHDLQANNWKQRTAQMAQALQMRAQSLGQRQVVIAQRASQALQNDSELKRFDTNIQQGNKAIGLLRDNNGDPRKDPNFMNYHEAIMDLGSQMSPNNTGVVAAAKLKGLSTKTLNEDVSRIQSYFTGKMEGGPTVTMNNQLADSIDRLKSVAESMHEKRLQSITRNAEGTGALNPDLAEFIHDNLTVTGDKYTGAKTPAKPNVKAQPGAGAAAGVGQPVVKNLTPEKAAMLKTLDPPARAAWLQKFGYPAEVTK